MKAVRFLLSSAAAAGLAAVANAQPPINMVAPPPPVPLGIAPQPPVPGSPTVWEKLGVSQQQQEFCKRKMCRTPFGQAMNTIVNPISCLSGGLIPPFCPTTPSLAELQDPGAIGAAAKVQQDRAGAADRIKAVKYLAGVDCSYWPEAEDALVNTLRGDRNECVRYEAAVALATGCCCTPKVVVALSNTVGCSTSDGGFMEKSARVRQAAEVALEHCMANCACGDLPPLNLDQGNQGGQGGQGGSQGEKGKEKKDDKQSSMLPTEDGPTAELKAYYKKVGKLPRSVIMNYAQQALVVGRQYGTRVNAQSNPSDLRAAGAPTQTDAASGPRPANLWDMLAGTEKPTATFAYTQTPVRTASATVVVAKPAPTVVATAAAPTPTTTPKTFSAVLSQTAEPPMKKAMPVAASEPAKTPAPLPTMPVVESKPVEKKKMPTTETAAPVQPAGVARVSKPAPVVPAPTYVPQQEVLVPAFAPMPQTMSAGAIPEPVAVRPAIPARQ
jgi:hypothetical protein